MPVSDYLSDNRPVSRWTLGTVQDADQRKRDGCRRLKVGRKCLGVNGSQVQILSSRRGEQGRYSIIEYRPWCFYQR